MAPAVGASVMIALGLLTFVVMHPNRNENGAGDDQPNDSHANARAASAQHAICSASGTPPRVAVLLVGNFRSFYDERVYRSIRANLIDALGARTTVFIYGKTDSEHVRGKRRDNGLSIDVNFISTQSGLQAFEDKRREQNIVNLKRAAAYLGSNGGPQVEMQMVNSTKIDLNSKCPWVFNGLKWEPYYMGQLQSHAMGYEMMAAYEARHHVRFDLVIKARLRHVVACGARLGLKPRLERPPHAARRRTPQALQLLGALLTAAGCCGPGRCHGPPCRRPCTAADVACSLSWPCWRDRSTHGAPSPSTQRMSSRRSQRTGSSWCRATLPRTC